MFVIGALIMVYNVWMTIASPESDEVPEKSIHAGALAAAE